MRAKILYADPGKRFLCGEIGEVLPNDFDKYAYKIDLGKSKKFQRIYYFFQDEVEILIDDHEPKIKVYCKKCSDWINENETQFINIEEDFQGADMLTFICPVCKTEQRSRRYSTS